MRSIPRLALFGALGLLAGACGRASAPGGSGDSSRPNVVLVTLDTVRADLLPVYGGTGIETPHLDAFSADSVVFDRMTALAPVTGPSHATLLTGLAPPSHGLRSNGASAIDPRAPRLAQAFTDAGWSTGAVVAARPVSSVYGFEHGFQFFHDAYPVRVKGPEVVKRAQGLLAKLSDPFFLWVHFFDAHKPYKPREPFLSKARALATGARPAAADPVHCGEDLTLYRGEIMGVDQDFGDLMKILEARDPGLTHTVVFVTSDHGHCFGEGGFLNEHQPSLLQATQHVVGMLRLPGSAHAGMRIGEPVSHVDVAPTLCEAAGLVPLPGAQGRSLLPLVRREPWDAGGFFRDGVYMEAFENQLRTKLSDGTFEDRRKRGFLAGRWKYWEWVDHPGGPFLYDLDQGEEKNLAPEMPDKVKQMKRILERLEQKLPPGRPGAVEMTPQERQALEELGYVQGEEPEKEQ